MTTQPGASGPGCGSSTAAPGCSTAGARRVRRCAIAPLKRISTAPATIASSTALIAIWPSWVSMTLAPSAMATSARPNSPPTASSTPVRQAVCGSTPTRRTSALTISSLLSRITSAPSSAQCSTGSTAAGSNSMPMPTKNRPSSTSRNGRIEASIWWRNSVSPSTMPARKPPKASDRPRLWVVQAASSATSSTVSVNISAERRSATWWISGRSR